MRIDSSVTSLSWIPSEAIEGLAKMPFEVGITHYDEPPPDAIEDLEALRKGDRFREANELRAYVEFEDGRVSSYGQSGGGHIGSTTVRLGPASIAFPAVRLADITPDPVVGPTSVRFVQTVGGRMGLPTPRPVPRKPYFQLTPPIAWTTLALTINSDGTTHHELVGASPFPRHWVYDHAGKLVAKSAVIDFKTWFNDSFGVHTPWGAYDSPAVVTAVETALERQLSRTIMRSGTSPRIRTIDAGESLVEQGDPGSEIFLLLDGVLSVIVDGNEVAEIGPGAILGERAILEGGLRTSTLRAVTRARVAVASPDQIEESALAEVATGHRREQAPS
jgi:hypothetical protein